MVPAGRQRRPGYTNQKKSLRARMAGIRRAFTPYNPMKFQTPLIEPLEQRIAPAHVISFTDIDGDKVLLTYSTGTLNVSTTAAGLGVQINEIDVTSGAHVNLSVVVVAKAAHGDGLVNVGQIVAETNVTLGTVTVQGDLGRIVAAGDGRNTDMAVQ